MEISVILIQKENGKKERLKERLRIRKKKKKEKKKEEKKNTLQDSNPALRPEDLSFSPPHTIRPPARGRVTSFPAYTNLTDK